MYVKLTNNVVVSLLFFTFGLVTMPPIFAAEKSVSSSLNVPFKYAVGKRKYQENCSSCHGTWMEGTKNGPPLLHGFYKPSHHNDSAFYRAALKGVPAHHWKFGDMPKVEGDTVRDMDRIVPFIRWFQQEKGLY